MSDFNERAEAEAAERTPPSSSDEYAWDDMQHEFVAGARWGYEQAEREQRGATLVHGVYGYEAGVADATGEPTDAEVERWARRAFVAWSMDDGDTLREAVEGWLDLEDWERAWWIDTTRAALSAFLSERRGS